MLEAITYYQIFGKPFIMYVGIIALISLLSTAAISILNQKGIHAIPFKWHSRMAVLTIILALVHGILGLLSYL